MENKRKIEDDKTTKSKRRGKTQPQLIPTPIPTPMVSKIGITSFPSPSSPPSLPLSYETSISEYPVDLFDFLMLPFSVILDDINKSEKQTLPQISPDANLLPRISQFLLSIKSDTNSEWYSNSYLCIPSYASKKQQNVILVLEPPTPSSSSSPPPHCDPLSHFSSSLLLLLDKISPLLVTNSLEIVININVGTEEGIQNEWRLWNSIFTSCNFHQKLFVGLSLKSLSISETELRERWKGERLKLVTFPSSLIPSTNKFPPILKKLLAHFSHIATYFVVQTDKNTLINDLITLQNLYKYLSMRVVSRSKVYGLEESFLPYLDKLQVPLQPLEENLTPEIYNVFEQCPVKYRKYQEAIYQTLRSKEPTTTSKRERRKDETKKGEEQKRETEDKTKKDEDKEKETKKREEEKEKREVVMVVGAGRGPLVLQTLLASQRARRPVRVYALDKNPHAVKALQELQQRKKWEDDEVVIVDADMRDWNPPEQADILVSELLGSFGDNELSPECLDAAQRFLKPNGVSIPKQYTSFLAPISSTPLYNEVINIVQRVSILEQENKKFNAENLNNNNNNSNNNNDNSLNFPINLTPEPAQQSNGNHSFSNNNNNINYNSDNTNNIASPPTPSTSATTNQITTTKTTPVRSLLIPPDYYFEVGYVVKFHNVLFLDSSQPCFTFSHPNLAPSTDGLLFNNNRHSKLIFTPKMDGLLHGFAGFFEAFLHEKISFSTNPPNNDTTLVAWFPMYFPLQKPILVHKGLSFEVNFWRKCSATKVWYEWCMGSPNDPSIFIYNVDGRAYSMKL